MKQELKQAIEEAYRISSSNSWIQKELQHSKRLAVELAMSDISILRHADPEIMKQAGWVREKDLVINTCMGCGKKFIGLKPKFCCSGRDCACRGVPIDPVVCNEECYDDVLNKRNLNNKP